MSAVSERIEKKYFVPPARLVVAQALVRRACRWDRDYPQEQINSLYFDNGALEQHERSISGDYAKDKVRVRWYGEAPRSSGTGCVPAPPGLVPVWIELKSRRGWASRKQRAPLQVPAEALEFKALRRGIVPAGLLLATVVGFGFLPRQRLEPVVAISYWRWRFVEPRTGVRVSLDSHIRSVMVKRGIGWMGRKVELPGAVIEVKSPGGELPQSLKGLGMIGSSWTRYSKYSASIEAHSAVPGDVSWLWPSGIVHVEPCTRVPKSGRGERECGSS